MNSRELARPEDKPLTLEIGPTLTQLDEIEYRDNEVARLQEKIENLTHQLAQKEPFIAPLERFRDILSLDCPMDLSRKTTILECTEKRKRQECIKKNCIPRTMLLAKINL